MTLQWLLPIGFLSLLGIGVLVLIYIIRPSYQKKLISSSYAWQRVLKRKKELPIDKFRNIILFICQALILVACGMVFARPSLMSKSLAENVHERIIIVDASASMRAHYAGDHSGSTRFDKALDEVRIAMDEVVMKQGGFVTVILADDDPEFVIDRVDRSGYSDAIQTINTLHYSNGHADIEAALRLVQDRAYNASTEVFIYSGTEFGDLGDTVKAVNLANLDYEWNVSVSGCDIVSEDNEFILNIELSAYGKVSMKKNMEVQIRGADLGLEDGSLSNLPTLTIPVTFDVNTESSGYEQRQVVSVRATDETIGGRADYYYSSFEEAIITIEGLNDSIGDDDTMTVYGGIKDTIKVQYASSEANIFYYLGFGILKDSLRQMRDIDFKQLDLKATPELTGRDLYIFEHSMPDVVIANGLPKDGVIFLVDPDIDIEGLGIKLGDKVTFNSMKQLSAGESHPLNDYMDASRSGVTEYTKVLEYDSDFVPLLYCGEDPVLLAKNTPSSKVIVMLFSLNMSDFIKWDFETLLYDIITYYFPLTVTQYNFEYGDTVTLNCKGESLVVANEKTSYVIRSFPTELKLDELGTFTFNVRSGLERPDVVRKIMVRIPHSESALFSVSNTRIVMNASEYYAQAVKDLFPYFAIAIIVMLFVEWWLQFRSEA